MRKGENVKKSLRTQKPRASRTVTLTEANRLKLLEVALEGTREAKARPKPQPMQETSKVLDELVEFLIQSVPEAKPDDIVEGALKALKSGIMGGNFVAPAEATLLTRVKQRIKELPQNPVAEVDASAGAAAEISNTAPGQMADAPHSCGHAASVPGDDELDEVPF